MITSNYKLTSYADYFNQLAAAFSTTVNQNKFFLPPAIGAGFFHLVPLDTGLEAIMYDFVLYDTLILNREPHGTEYYTLVYDELEPEKGFKVTIDSEIG